MLVPAGLGRDSRSAAAVKTVNVKTLDTRISLSAKTAPVGKVKFVVKNLGKKPHNFQITARRRRRWRAASRARSLVTFKRAGAYPYLSTLPGDAKAGLKGTFKLTAPPKPATPGDAKAGKSLFVANCGSCHMLKAANTRGTIGPNLDTTNLAYATIVKIVTNGKNGSAGAMPPLRRDARRRAASRTSPRSSTPRRTRSCLRRAARARARPRAGRSRTRCSPRDRPVRAPKGARAPLPVTLPPKV